MTIFLPVEDSAVQTASWKFLHFKSSPLARFACEAVAGAPRHLGSSAEMLSNDLNTQSMDECNFQNHPMVLRTEVSKFDSFEYENNILINIKRKLLF